ncbi:SDR family oxidoreductase [Nocardia xishanensis]|uniref:SDR family oxidoreductase n=1 Tax=Nocardia xishanensis TaxID=238964 RepID=UPI00082F5BF5|nr:SDR family NAD(P)-dependent oxidoreductase [Nocardia xishanensis]
MKLEQASERRAPRKGGLAGRVAIVTGSGSGIGEGIARRLSSDGAHVIVSDVSTERAEAVADSLRANDGTESVALHADVRDPDAVRALVKAATDNWGRLDFFVNNAGIGEDTALRKITADSWDRVTGINLSGVFHGCQAAGEVMREQRSGRIVNIASRAWLGWWGQANYSATKGGVVSLTRALALELARSGITVNAVAPGLIRTPAVEKGPQSILDNLILAQPTRTLGSADDIAHLVRFLIDDRAHSITGQVIYSCGGKSIFAMPAKR